MQTFLIKIYQVVKELGAFSLLSDHDLQDLSLAKPCQK